MIGVCVVAHINPAFSDRTLPYLVVNVLQLRQEVVIHVSATGS